MGIYRNNMKFEEKVRKICESESAFQKLMYQAFGGQEDELVNSMLSQLDLANLKVLQNVLSKYDQSKSKQTETRAMNKRTKESFVKWITENQSFFSRFVEEVLDDEDLQSEDIIENEELFQYGYELVSLLLDQELYSEIEIVEPDNDYYDPEKFKAFITTIDGYTFVLELETPEYEEEEMEQMASEPEELPQEEVPLDVDVNLADSSNK